MEWKDPTLFQIPSSRRQSSVLSLTRRFLEYRFTKESRNAPLEKKFDATFDGVDFYVRLVRIFFVRDLFYLEELPINTGYLLILAYERIRHSKLVILSI